jgi:two-component system NarL family sensor kinase
MEDEKLRTLIALITITFLIMPAFMMIYFFVYTKKKKNHLEEKKQMKETFDQEILNAEQEVREQTMQTIGADLHDNIGQLLSLTSLTLKSLDRKSLTDTDEKVTSSIELLGRAINEMRLLGKLLQGDQLLATGLEHAIKQEVDWLTRSGRYKITFTKAIHDDEVISPSKDLICFRILQEILNNIIKHAQAKKIVISLATDDKELVLSVKDDGIGFAENEPGYQGNGLSNIRKRASIIGGTASIQSAPKKGTHITIKLPYP